MLVPQLDHTGAVSCVTMGSVLLPLKRPFSKPLTLKRKGEGVFYRNLNKGTFYGYPTKLF